MNLSQCLEDLKYDIRNDGIADDTFAMICYMTMANKARRLLRSSASNQQEVNVAREYLTMCRNSGSDGLRCVAEG